jgi:hypothetical protein
MPVQAPIASTRLAGAAAARSPAVRRQTSDAEAMDLGDDGVGSDAMPQFGGDLAHPRALRPASAQQPQARLRPRRDPSPRRRPQTDGLLQHHPSRIVQILLQFAVNYSL